VPIFRGALRVHGVRPPTDAAATCTELGLRTGVDVRPFLRVLGHRRGNERLQPADVHDVLEGCLTGLAQLVAHLDRLRPAAGPVS
jgi:hypothetical protein